MPNVGLSAGGILILIINIVVVVVFNHVLSISSQQVLAFTTLCLIPQL